MSSTIERKLAAIMFTDISGYTAHMSKDEAVAISLLNKKESILKPLIKEYNGTYVKSTGDGSLSHFNSAVDAVMCAKRLQESLYDDKVLNIRVGIHLGDTIFQKGDIRGDGVNIASRLQNIAVEGGVFVSKEVHDQLSNQKEFKDVSLGLQSMKGVGRLIEVYGLKGDKLTEPNPDKYQNNRIDKHSGDKTPSIAIIPFKNKGKQVDVFYTYGISIDLISDVSSAGLIRVASKKQIDEAGKQLTQDEIAKVLDVRYLANGELWRRGDMFQLSVELYDTEHKKIVWSDRWEENWENLSTIKGILSDGLLKALSTKPKVEKKLETTNPEAYEFYLKSKHKYDNRINTEDTGIARGLLKKAIELDDNLIVAKVLLGATYSEMGDYNMAMKIYTPALKHAEGLGDKRGVGKSLNAIGSVYSKKGDYHKAVDYYERSLAIAEQLGDKHGTAVSLHNIGTVHSNKCDYDTALDYYARSLTIQEELNDKDVMGDSLIAIGVLHSNKGDYDTALDYYDRSFAICEEVGNKAGMGYTLDAIGTVYSNKGDVDTALTYYERSLIIREKLGDKRGMGDCLENIGVMHHYKSDYEKAEEYLEKTITIQKEIGLGADSLIWSTTYLYLTYKYLGKNYNKNEIHSLIKKSPNFIFDLNLRLYKLLEDNTYLVIAYNQVKEKASAMEDKLKIKFLTYPIPKAIVEEYNKVFEDK